MSEDALPSLDEADRPGGYLVEALLGVVLLIVGGLVLVNIANAFAAEPDCNSYGGYTCADLTDAVLMVEPSTGLAARQTVDVTGANFDPHGGSFGAAQCDAATVPSGSIGSCDLSTSTILSVDDNGNVAFQMQLRRIITTGNGVEIDCADPGACVVGAGTLGSGLTTVIEGTSVPIQFDPDIPPIPDLEVSLTVTEVTANLATGTVTCNRDATFAVDLSVEQTKNSRTAYGYGYSGEESACSVNPTTWSLALVTGGGQRLVGGKATYFAYAYAYDGFDNAFADTVGVATLKGGPRPTLASEEVAGAFTSISIIGVTGKGDTQAIELEVTCDRPTTYASASVGVSQWAGLSLVSAYGSVDISPCDGTQRVLAPIVYVDGGSLTGGPARVVASVNAQDYGPPDYFFDYASTTSTVKLAGQLRPSFEIPPPNPNSRITISNVSRAAISGTVRCDEPAMIFLYGGGVQTSGRNVSFSNGFTEFECNGATPFSLTLEEPAKGGKIDVVVYADAYRDDGEFEYEYLWFDQQSLSTNVRGR